MVLVLATDGLPTRCAPVDSAGPGVRWSRLVRGDILETEKIGGGTIVCWGGADKGAPRTVPNVIDAANVAGALAQLREDAGSGRKTRSRFYGSPHVMGETGSDHKAVIATVQVGR